MGAGADLAMALDRVTFAREALGFQPDGWQADLLGGDTRRVLLNCSRQSGKSTLAALIALHRALYYPESLVLILAPAMRQSVEAFGKVLAAYRALGRPVPSRSEQKMSLELDNGSRVVSLPGTEKTVRGYSGAALLIVDEAARVDDALYFAVRPMLAVSGGSLIMLSTPWGKRGVFFEEWSSEAGAGSWERYRVSASEVPRISEMFLEEERRSLPARIFRQEYECSFEDVDDQVFSYELVEGAITPEVAPLFAATPDDREVAPLFGGASRG